jgi:Ca2+-transporting ATPase
VHCNAQRIQLEGRRFIHSGRLFSPPRLEAFQRLCEAVALCNETELNGDAANPRLNGSATETALIEMALHAGLDIVDLRRRHPRVELRQRAEDRPYMVSIHRGAAAGECRVAVKGSPEHVLALCRYQFRNGLLSPLNGEARKSILRENERMAGAALRVLGIAQASGSSEPECLEQLVWLGLVGMTDPLRPGLALLLKRFHDAGINTAMITGDQSATAYAIAKQLDLANGQPVEILDAGSLDRMDPDVLSGVAQRVQVFARVSPAHKLEIVQALQQARKVVAMTGDGINDGPALKAADLGVAMGKDGTEVARSLADIVLEDDNLETMEVAVRHGRAIYDNVRKAIRFLLATNLSEIEVMLAGIGLGLGQPLNPLQLLWINLISDIFPGLALALEQPEADIMSRPPRDPGEPVIGARDLRRLGLESTVISAGALASYGYAVWRYGSGPQASTQAFMTLTLGQLLHALSSRSETRSLLDRERLPPNRYLDAALGLSLLAQLLTVLAPGLRKVLGNSTLDLTDSLVIGAGSILPLLLNELTKKAFGVQHWIRQDRSRSSLQQPTGRAR